MKTGVVFELWVIPKKFQRRKKHKIRPIPMVSRWEISASHQASVVGRVHLFTIKGEKISQSAIGTPMNHFAMLSSLVRFVLPIST